MIPNGNGPDRDLADSDGKRATLPIAVSRVRTRWTLDGRWRTRTRKRELWRRNCRSGVIVTRVESAGVDLEVFRTHTKDTSASGRKSDGGKNGDRRRYNGCRRPRPRTRGEVDTAKNCARRTVGRNDELTHYDVDGMIFMSLATDNITGVEQRTSDNLCARSHAGRVVFKTWRAASERMCGARKKILTAPRPAVSGIRRVPSNASARSAIVVGIRAFF